MLVGRLQVLTDRDDVDVVRAQIAQRLDNLVVSLAHADDDAALRQQRAALREVLCPQLLGAAQDVECAVVVALDAHLRLDPAHGLDVVVVDVRLGLEHRQHPPVLVAEEVGHQHLDLQVGIAPA